MHDESEDGEAANPNAPNYHHTQQLDERHLPELDYYRWDNVFSAKVGNRWLRHAGEQKCQQRLFGELWHEGELAILFADTGKGKSILAVQIGQSIASGVPIEPFVLNAPAQRVVYFDFELTAQQFASRYASVDASANNAPFSDNFIRAAPRFDDEDIPDEFKDYTEFLVYSLTEFIRFSGARIVIIDNITWLNTSTQSITGALRLMKQLKQLKVRHNLSILVLAHTPKRYVTSSLTLNDLQGSKMLANFADNIFAMGGSAAGPDIRYLKHLKYRNAAIRHDATNVITLRIGRHPVSPNSRSSVAASADGAVDPPSPDFPTFLSFEYVGTDRERDHVGWLGGQHDAERHAMHKKAEELSSAGHTQREIAEALGVSPATVNRYLRLSTITGRSNDIGQIR